MVVPCPSVQPVEEALEDCLRKAVPILLYAANQDQLTPAQVCELQTVRQALPFPICFVRMSTERVPGAGRDRAALQKQLLSLGFLSSPAGNCSCGAPPQSPTLPPSPRAPGGQPGEAPPAAGALHQAGPAQPAGGGGEPAQRPALPLPGPLHQPGTPARASPDGV